MKTKLDPHIIELESKMLILERENEALSARAEENFLLNRAFEEIDNYEEIDSLLMNTLESISILLDVQFSGIFNLVDKQFKCISSYALFNNEDTVSVHLDVSDKIHTILSLHNSCYINNGDANITFENSNTDFPACCFVIISNNSSIYKNRYFVFVNDTNCQELKFRIPLLEKVIQIISAKLEKLFFQNELKKVNKELQTGNEELQTINEELSKKSRIINDQNTELKATMQYLKETQAHLVQAEKMASLGVLTSGVAHEINNPLNYILGGYTGLENYFIKTDQLQNKNITVFLNSIKTGVDRAAKIVSGLNQFSRNKDSFEEDCNIHSILDNCLLMLNNQLKHRIEIQKNFTIEPYSITGNVGKLHQVFINILSNASQAIKTEGIISITSQKHKRHITIEITDTGRGICKEILPKIIDPFFTTKDPGQGTGLGLSICYSIIEEHKGKLEFESEINNGTTVKITLPINQ